MSRPYQKAIKANDWKKENGGTVVWGGNADTTNGPITNAPDTTVTTRSNNATFGSKVQDPETDATIAAGTDTAPTYKPLSAGNFATMAAGYYIIKAGSQDQIAGTTVSGLRKAANPMPGYRKKAVRARYNIRTIVISSWNYATGAATISSDGSTADTVEAADGTTPASYRAADDAADPTMSVPGELCYIEDGKSPTTDEYQERTHS